MAKRITVVVPVFNEAGNVALLHTHVGEVFAALGPDYQHHLLFVDDGSTDESLERIHAIKENDAAVSVVQLSRNFGKEAALSAGIAHAEGDAIVLMDADLQHPPKVIAEFVRAWEAGADVVIGVRGTNPDEGFVRKTCSRLFSSILRAIGDVPTVTGATDYRLLDRRVAEEFKRFTEHGRMARGLIDWLGFKRAYVPFAADKRNAGTAQYSSRRLVSLALSAFFSHSLVPLRIAGYLGFCITFFAGSLGLFLLIEQLFLGDPLMLQIPATALLAVMIMFLNGILLICIGLMSLYIARIHNEAVNRPLYIVRKRGSE